MFRVSYVPGILFVSLLLSNPGRDILKWKDIGICQRLCIVCPYILYDMNIYMYYHACTVNSCQKQMHCDFLYKFYPDAMSGSVMATLASCIACNICHCEHVLADCWWRRKHPAEQCGGKRWTESQTSSTSGSLH